MRIPIDEDIITTVDRLQHNVLHVAQTPRDKWRAYRQLTRFVDMNVYHLQDIRDYTAEKLPALSRAIKAHVTPSPF
jgi:hypothetical protein